MPDDPNESLEKILEDVEYSPGFVQVMFATLYNFSYGFLLRGEAADGAIDSESAMIIGGVLAGFGLLLNSAFTIGDAYNAAKAAYDSGALDRLHAFGAFLKYVGKSTLTYSLISAIALGVGILTAPAVIAYEKNRGIYEAFKERHCLE